MVAVAAVTKNDSARSYVLFRGIDLMCQLTYGMIAFDSYVTNTFGRYIGQENLV